MITKPISIVLDTNIWISFAIGKRLSVLKPSFVNPNIEIFVCKKLLLEVNKTLNKTKIAKYVSTERSKILLDIISTRKCVFIDEKVNISSDRKDNYLLDLAATVKADFLVTGDNDLLVLQNFSDTKIITFNSFVTILESLS